MYFTPDWVSARASVQSLAALSPDVVITGHGQAMQGQEMPAGSQFGIADADWGAKSNFWFRASLRRGGGKTEIGSGSCPVSSINPGEQDEAAPALAPRLRSLDLRWRP
jgi:hypothetical protein